MAKNDTAPTQGTRPRKSAAEKAQADLDRAQKAVDKNQEAVSKYETALAESNQRLAESQAYLDYVSRNPALPGVTEAVGDVSENVPVDVEP